MSRRDPRHVKLERKAKKAAKKNRRQSQRQRELHPSYSLLSGLDEAEELLKKGNLNEAAEVLEELRRRYPRRVEVLQLLRETYFRQHDMWAYQVACQQTLDLCVDGDIDNELWLTLGAAALTNGQMVTALRAFDHHLAHLPEFEPAAGVRTSRDELDAFLRSESANLGVSVAEGFELFALHEAVNLHLHQGDYEKVCETAKRLLVRWPTFAPALNNRCEALFRLGRIEHAIADARRVLDFDAENFHALANLTRFLVLFGRSDEAAEFAGRLQAVNSDDTDLFVKRAEALSFLGNWTGVLETFDQAQRRGDVSDGLLYYLAGVAAANVGQADVARKHWERAIKLRSAGAWAQENLDDLKLPTGKQNGPWAFPVSYWIPQVVIERLIVDFERSGPQAKGAAVRRRVRAFFETHPYLERLMPKLLEFGDSAAREFVVKVVTLARLPSVFAALKEFALSRRGTDQLRHQAAMVLVEAGELPSGQLRMWWEGEQRELLLLSHEISPEPTEPLPKGVERLAGRAQTALQDRDGAAAEALFAEALRLHPDHASLAYNRAMAVAMQGRNEEAMSLVREIHARHPDYLFARARLAEEAVERGDFDTAQNLLDPLLSRRRFHHSEYGTFCHAQISLLSAKGSTEGARSWLQMWRQVDPDNPGIELWQRRIGKRSLLGSFIGTR
jgi:tetratricopeptide (TPR) repeat protein